MQILIISIFLLFGLFFLGAKVVATPAQVVIIRHGEKIDDIDPNLSEKGQKRAKALVDLFLKNPELSKYGSPVAIFATNPKANGSLRSIQTVTPLSERIGQPINRDFSKKKIPALVDFIMQNPSYKGRTVVISWVHESIPELAKKFGSALAPIKWKSRSFDRVWILNFDPKAVFSFKDIPQKLLPGDSSN